MRPLLFLLAAVLISLPVSSPVQAAQCFAASKVYQIHPIHGGRNSKQGWSVEGDEFAQCVHRAEAADKALHARFPDSAYELSLAATIGCHASCN